MTASDVSLTLIMMVVGAGLVVIASGLMIGQSFRARHKRHVLRKIMDAGTTSEPLRTSQTKTLRSFRSINLLALAAGGSVGLALAHIEPMINWPTGLRLAIILCALYLGYRFPRMQAEKQKIRYRKDIERDLPAMTDLLIVMLDSGASFDEAVSRLVKDNRFPQRPIHQELKRLAYELAISPDRRTAFEKFAALADVNDLRLFSTVLVQSEMFGTPISRGLRGLAYDMRERQLHRIEAQGGKLGPKLTIPMTVFFLPLIFIVVLAPTIIRAFRLP